MAAAVQRWDRCVDLRCTAGFVAFTGHRVAVLVSGSVLGWRRGSTVAVAIRGGRTVAVSVGVAIAGDVTVSVRVSVGLGRMSVRVPVGSLGTVRVGLVRGADRQIALHVVLGRRVRTVDLAEQAVVRVLTVGAAAWGFTISGPLALRYGEDVRLHSVLVHAAWSLGLVVGTEKVAASTTWRLQNSLFGVSDVVQLNVLESGVRGHSGNFDGLMGRETEVEPLRKVPNGAGKLEIQLENT